MTNDLTPLSRALPSTEKKSGARPGNKHAQRIPPKLRDALKALAAGAESVEIAAERAGMSRSGLYAALDKVHVREELNRLCERDIAVIGVPRAKAQLIKQVESTSPYVALDASKTILRNAGVLRSDDDGRRERGIGSITIHIGARPGEAVKIEAQPLPSGQEPEEQ